MQHFTSSTHTDHLPSRCRATECAGLIFEGLGGGRSSGSGSGGSGGHASAEALSLLESAVPGFMHHALAGFELAAGPSASSGPPSSAAPTRAAASVCELREYGHGMFTCVAKV